MFARAPGCRLYCCSVAAIICALAPPFNGCAWADASGAANVLAALMMLLAEFCSSGVYKLETLSDTCAGVRLVMSLIVATMSRKTVEEKLGEGFRTFGNS